VNPLLTLGAGLVLGFSLTVPPGPMNALIAHRAMGSFRAGVATGFGAMTADAVLGGVVFAVRSVVNLGVWVRPVEALGAVVLAVMAWRLFHERVTPDAPVASDVRVYSQALGVGLSNPFQILWWLTAGLAFAYVGGLILFVGLFGAIAIWIVVFPGILRTGVRASPRVPIAVAWASAALLAGFAGYFALGAAGLVL
jgi:threonine/homoserine/homoserine lactone efflux protein